MQCVVVIYKIYFKVLHGIRLIFFISRKLENKKVIMMQFTVNIFDYLYVQHNHSYLILSETVNNLSSSCIYTKQKKNSLIANNNKLTYRNTAQRAYRE